MFGFIITVVLLGGFVWLMRQGHPTGCTCCPTKGSETYNKYWPTHNRYNAPNPNKKVTAVSSLDSIPAGDSTDPRVTAPGKNDGPHKGLFKRR